MINIDEKEGKVIIKGDDKVIIDNIANLAQSCKNYNTLSKEILIKAIELGYLEDEKEQKEISNEIIKILIDKKISSGNIDNKKVEKISDLLSELTGKDEVEEEKEFKIGDKVWVNMMFSDSASDFASILNLSFEDTHEKGEIIDIDEKNSKYWGGKYLIKFDDPAYITAGYDADNLKLIEGEEEIEND